MEEPFVSIIIPVLNAEKEVGRAIQALLALDYPRGRMEIIVADNGSSDGTRDIVRSYPVIVLVEAGHHNAYTARNVALGRSSGELLAFTDADCQVDPQWLRSAVATMQSTGAPMVGGRVVFTYPKSPKRANIVDSLLYLDNERWIRQRGCAVTANLIVRKEVVAAIGPFPDDVPVGGDFRWTAEASSRGYPMVFDPGAIVYHPARCLRGLLGKSYRTGRVYWRWPGLQGRPVSAALRRIMRGFVPATRTWIRRLATTRGYTWEDSHWFGIWSVLWLTSVCWACGAVTSVLAGLMLSGRRRTNEEARLAARPG